MVTDAILDWWFGLCEWVVSLLPVVTNPMEAFGLGWINDMNYFLPVAEMFGLFAVFFALGGPFVASSLVIWVIVGLLRGGATKA